MFVRRLGTSTPPREPTFWLSEAAAEHSGPMFWPSEAAAGHPAARVTSHRKLSRAGSKVCV